MPTLEATRKPQKENISPNKEQQSSAFTIPYTYRRLFGGGMDSFHDPFTRSMIRSDQKTELQFAEGAFSLPKNQAPLRKLCHNLGITPPVSKEDIPEFIRSQIAEIKDSEGNNHFENQLVNLLFSHPENEEQVINAIQTAEAPENPDSCAEIKVNINGEKLEAHAHGSYQGNNKSRIALFALLGHKPSQEFLAKWVEKDTATVEGHAHHHDHVEHKHTHHHTEKHEDHEEHEHDHHDCGHDHSNDHSPQVTFNGSPEQITQQVASVINQRLEAETHHDAHEESVKNAELSQEERIDSVASITIAHVISPEDADIKEAFDQIASNNYIGQIDLKKKEPEPLQKENEALTEHFITTLKVLREETHQEQDEQSLQKGNALVTLSLARLHNKEITLEDVLANYEYPPKDEKIAAIMLAKAIEIVTRPGLDQKNLPQKERNHSDTTLQLRQDYGISFINYTTSHNANNPFHKIVKPNGVIDSCPDHAQETKRLDQKLRETHNKVKEKLQRTYHPRQTQLPNQREIVRGGVLKTETAKTQLTRPVLETLSALGNTEASEKLQSLEKQEAWDKRFNAMAEIIHGAVLVRNEITKEMLEKLMEEKPFGIIEDISRKPSKAIREANEEHTQTFKEKLTAVRQEKAIDSQTLALTLAKMHDPTIETLIVDEKIPEYTQLTRTDVIKILALDMAIQTKPNKKEPSPQEKKIARYARRINEERGIHYVNLTMNHATALHLVEIVKGGVKVVDACPDHTQQVDKMLQKMQTVAKQQVAQFNQIPVRIMPFNRLQPVRGGVVEQPKHDQKKVIPPASEPQLNRPSGRSKQRPITPAGEERPVSFRPLTRHDTRGSRKNEQTKKTDAKPEAKRHQQLTAFVRKVAGATGFVPSYFRKVDKPSDADFSFTVSTPTAKTNTRETRVIKPAVFLQPASSGRPPEGVRIVKNSRDADRVESIATARLVRGTSTDMPRSQIKEPTSELGRSISVQEKAPSVAVSESPTATRESSKTKVRPAAEVAALAKVRAEISEIKSSSPKIDDSAQFSTEAKIIPFPSKRVAVSKEPQTSGGQALAAVISLTERRELRKQKTASAVAKVATKSTLRAATQQKAITVEVAPPAPTKPQLRLVRSPDGIPAEQIPKHATSSAPKDAPSVTIRPTEKPTLTLVTEGDVGIDKIPAGLKTTNNPSEATGGHSISTGKGSRRSSTSRTSSKRSSEGSSNHGSDQPQNTLNPHDSVTKSIKKITGEQTTRQVEQAFAKKEEAEVEQQVAQQMEQAAQTTEEEAQVALGATLTEKEQTKTAKRYEGTNAGIEEHTEDRDTVVQTETGEYAKIREKTSRVSVSGTSNSETRKSEENQASDETSTGQDTSATASQRTQQANAEVGTNEEAQQTDAQQRIAPVIPLSSRRKNQQKIRMSARSSTAQIAANDGYYLPMDPFETRDALRQAFAEIAA